MNNAELGSDRQQPSDRKIAANQANAQKSTGPRGAPGKAKSSQNAIKFGFYARAVVMEGEDPQAYEDLRDQLWSELSPQNAIEAVYAREIIDTHWRLQRLAFVETGVFTRRSLSFTGQDCGPGFAFINDAQGHSTLSKLTNYEATLSRRLHRALEQLRKLREEGWKDLAPCSNADLGRSDPMSEGEVPQPAAGRPVGALKVVQETDVKQPPTPSDPRSTPSATIPSASKFGESEDGVTPDTERPKTTETH